MKEFTKLFHVLILYNLININVVFKGSENSGICN